MGARFLSSASLRGAVAQLGERLDRTQEVRGSSPLSSMIRCHLVYLATRLILEHAAGEDSFG
jgi:hypothetical protein